MKRTSELARRSPMKRGRKRPRAERVRIYGPEAFAEHVRRSPCLWCGLEGAIQQAHLVGNHAMSKKNDWTTTGPMCGPAMPYPSCHDRFDRRAKPFFTHNERAEILRRQKAFVESWLNQQSDPEQRSA